MRNIGVFVNLNNQYTMTGQQFHGSKIDYEEYLKQAVGNDKLFRAIAYGVQLKNEALPFIESLRKIGFEPKYQKARIVDGRPSIRNTDWTVGIAVDAIRHVPKLETVVLGSNDLRLVPLIQYLKDQCIRVVVFSCCVGPELCEVADEVREIDESLLEKQPT